MFFEVGFAVYVAEYYTVVV